MAVNMCQPHRARAQNCKALPDRLLISALFAAALAQPTAETSDHGRGQQECDDHAHADEQIGENYSGAAVDGHDARRRFASMPLYGQWSGSPRWFNALSCFNVRLDLPTPGAMVAALDREQESGSTSGQARSGGGLGSFRSLSALLVIPAQWRVTRQAAISRPNSFPSRPRGPSWTSRRPPRSGQSRPRRRFPPSMRAFASLYAALSLPIGARIFFR